MERGGLRFRMIGFCLDPMPLSSSIEGKIKRVFTALSTLLMLFDRKSVLLDFSVFLRIALKALLQTDATDFKNLGIRQVVL